MVTANHCCGVFVITKTDRSGVSFPRRRETKLHKEALTLYLGLRTVSLSSLHICLFKAFNLLQKGKHALC
jgi:hypothetical protein